MKRLFLAIICLGSTIAFAGTPKQDPIIKNLMERYTVAATPSLDDLQLGKKWTCMYFSAARNDFDRFGTYITNDFVQVGGFIRGSYQQDYVIGDKEMTARYPTSSGDMAFESYRYDKTTRSLLTEIAVQFRVLDVNLFIEAPVKPLSAIKVKRARVIFYGECTVK